MKRPHQKTIVLCLAIISLGIICCAIIGIWLQGHRNPPNSPVVGAIDDLLVPNLELRRFLSDKMDKAIQKKVKEGNVAELLTPDGLKRTYSDLLSDPAFKTITQSYLQDLEKAMQNTETRKRLLESFKKSSVLSIDTKVEIRSK